jgi:non-specific serine/threonine protein kinase
MEQTVLPSTGASLAARSSADLVGPGGALLPGTQLREFEVVETIGEGGFSIVYAARDLRLGREVAIKEYIPSSLAGRAAGSTVRVRSEQHRESFEAGLAGFMNEARLLAQFKHPALVEVLQFWEENGTAYMVMPRYRGKTLRQVLKEQTARCGEQWLKTTLSPVLDVLDLLHARSVYHRDIAPDNILIQNRGGAVLLDLGSAREILGDRDSSVTVVVKPGYAPLEQYSGEFALPQGPWTDVYAFGALLHFAVTGSPPQASISRIMKDGCQPLAGSNRPGFSERFLAAIDSALALQPGDRPQTARALRDALGVDEASPAPAPSAGSAALAATHHDEAITAIVSAEEMADIVDQVARSMSGVPTQAIDPSKSPPPSDAVSVSATFDPPKASITGADLFAQPAAVDADSNAFPEMDDLLAGRLVGTTENVKVVSESRLETRIDSDAATSPAEPRRAGLLISAAAVVLIGAGAAAIWFGMGDDALAPASDRPAGAEPAAVAIIPSATPAPTRAERRAAALQAEAPQVVEATGSNTVITPPAAAEPSDDASSLAQNDNAASADSTESRAEAGSFGQDERSDSRTATTEPRVEASVPASPPSEARLSSPALAGSARGPQPLNALPAEVWATPEIAPAQPESIDVAEPEKLAAVVVEPRAGANTRRPAANAAPVDVRLSIQPWGEVWVDGTKRGISPPMRQMQLTPGSYRVEIRNGDLPPLVRELEVSAGAPITLEHRFAAAPAGP